MLPVTVRRKTCSTTELYKPCHSSLVHNEKRMPNTSIPVESRETLSYDYAGGATDKDAKELIEFTNELRDVVKQWLQSNHIELLLPDDQV